MGQWARASRLSGGTSDANPHFADTPRLTVPQPGRAEPGDEALTVIGSESSAFIGPALRQSEATTGTDTVNGLRRNSKSPTRMPSPLCREPCCARQLNAHQTSDRPPSASRSWPIGGMLWSTTPPTPKSSRPTSWARRNTVPARPQRSSQPPCHWQRKSWRSAWRDHAPVILADNDRVAVRPGDHLEPEHLEV